MTAGELRELAQLAAATGGALLTLGGVAAAAYRYTVARHLVALRGEMEGLRDDVRAVKRQVEPNGTDAFLEQHERGQTTRTLVVRSRTDIRDMRRQLKAGNQRFERLEREHEGRDR